MSTSVVHAWDAAGYPLLPLYTPSACEAASASPVILRHWGQHLGHLRQPTAPEGGQGAAASLLQRRRQLLSQRAGMEARQRQRWIYTACGGGLGSRRATLLHDGDNSKARWIWRLMSSVQTWSPPSPSTSSSNPPPWPHSPSTRWTRVTAHRAGSRPSPGVFFWNWFFVLVNIIYDTKVLIFDVRP
jgi:hypothetical protein